MSVSSTAVSPAKLNGFLLAQAQRLCLEKYAWEFLALRGLECESHSSASRNTASDNSEAFFAGQYAPSHVPKPYPVRCSRKALHSFLSPAEWLFRERVAQAPPHSYKAPRSVGFQTLWLADDLLRVLATLEGKLNLHSQRHSYFVLPPTKRLSQAQSEDVYIACKSAMAELILSGCTTTSDHTYLYPNDVLLDDCIRASR